MGRMRIKKRKRGEKRNEIANLQQNMRSTKDQSFFKQVVSFALYSVVLYGVWTFAFLTIVE